MNLPFHGPRLCRRPAAETFQLPRFMEMSNVGGIFIVTMNLPFHGPRLCRRPAAEMFQPQRLMNRLGNSLMFLPLNVLAFFLRSFAAKSLPWLERTPQF